MHDNGKENGCGSFLFKVGNGNIYNIILFLSRTHTLTILIFFFKDTSYSRAIPKYIRIGSFEERVKERILEAKEKRVY